MIGAVVGVQPFGGRGLSGTGPKAAGPHWIEVEAHWPDGRRVVAVASVTVGPSLATAAAP